MALTNHQEEILVKGLNILSEEDRLVIKGSAGCGKTFMVNELVKRFPTYGKIYCTAPTNKAVKVLRGKVDEIKGLEFLTTHQALKIKMFTDFKTGEAVFKPSFDRNKPPLRNISLLIVDEASMLNTVLLGYIEEYATRFNVKVIFIGDEKQINPVGEDNSPVFHKDYPEVELTEIVRQGKDNPVIDLSRNLEIIGSGNEKINIDSEERKHGYMYSNDERQVIETLAHFNGTDDLKFLCWTNKVADKINQKVRERIYGNPAKLEIGESMIFNTPYKETYIISDEIVINTLAIREKEFQFVIDKNGKVNPDFGEDPYYGKVKLKYYSINPQDEFDDSLIVVHEHSEVKFKSTIGLLRAKARIQDVDWVDVNKFINTFADLKYNHAMTVHKSQGSTFKQTIVDIGNVKLNRNKIELERLLYTAVTRTSELLVLYNAKFKRDKNW